jgi:peroxiredoxin
LGMRVCLFISAIAMLSCNRTSPTHDGPASVPAPVGSAAMAGPARVGSPAPDFDLVDLDGKRHRLSDHRSKTVVLEWFNPECPFVNKSHTKGSLRDTARRHTDKGTVWLAINSNAPGKQGYGPEKNREGARRFGMQHPILLDESGSVGRAYGAKTTPHMYVIDERGTLVYGGAIDNSPDGEGESPSGDKLVNHVDEALGALAAGKPVLIATTEPYGCSVKYSN